MLRVGFALWFGFEILLRMQAQTRPEVAPPLRDAAQPLRDAAAPMARSISSLLPRRATVSFDFQVLATVSPAESSSFRAALEDELRKTGIEIKEAAPAEPRLRVAVSENPRGLLLIAEVVSNDAKQTVLAQWSQAVAADARPMVRIEMTPVAGQSEPILDVLMLDSGTDSLLLSPTKVTALRLTNGKWVPAGQASLDVARPVPRDARGRLLSVAGTLRVFLPGTTCTGQLNPQILFTCVAANEMWPLNIGDGAVPAHWANDRNVLESEAVRGPFYSGARGWFASSDGKIQNRAGEAVAGTENWGSDLVVVDNSCGSGRTVIVASGGRNPENDQIQAFTISSDQPAAASVPLAIAGTVTALWPAERPARATLVIRDSKTGNYEASRLALACAE